MTSYVVIVLQVSNLSDPIKQLETKYRIFMQN